MDNNSNKNTDFFKKKLESKTGDILSKWLEFRAEDISEFSCEEDKEHVIYFDEISEKILNNIPNDKKDFVKSKLEKIGDNFSDYMAYWFDKYYINGFCDAIELISGCLR